MNFSFKIFTLCLLLTGLMACETVKTTDTRVRVEPASANEKKQPHGATRAETLPDQEHNARIPSSASPKNRPLESPEEMSAATTPLPIQSTGQNLADSTVLQHRHKALAKAARLTPGMREDYRIAMEPDERENYAHLDDNPIKRASEHPVSTFSIDVDTGSYSNVRRILRDGRLPVHDAVRVEEMINYFSYQYPVPDSTEFPFSVTTEIAPSPWSSHRHLLRIGIKGYEIPKEALKAANLVFLIDVSGSMRSPNKLDLLKKSLVMLTKQLGANDRVSVVVYAGASGVVLDSTPGNARATIINALERLTAGGSTNGGAGIRLAYRMAEQSYIPGGINRILLATDGDFNVGTTSFESLKSLVEEKRKTGISLTTLGFGSGNYNDHLAEQLADHGNGANYYIDSLQEARKVLVDQMSSTMQTIAGDTKIQVEFNPATVSEYRLIGYENRLLRREDFKNDKVDAGDIGAGHTVTALYEITLSGNKGQMEPLRYSPPKHKLAVPSSSNEQELAYLRLRYKMPGSMKSTLLEKPLYSSEIHQDIAYTSIDFRFAASVAAFGQLLKGGKHTGAFTYTNVLDLARTSRGLDPFGYRSEFLQLVGLASGLTSTGPVHNSH